MATQIIKEIQKMSKILLRQYDFIGKGASAQVYRYQISDTPLAVKCFKTEEKAKQEMDIIEQIQAIAADCPGIVQYYGMKQLQIEVKGVITQNYSGYAIFLQQCLCDLQRISRLPTQEVFNLLSQISLSLFCLHKNDCIHGDVKPANILVSNANEQSLIYYLTDYGQGKCLTPDYKALSLRGTPFYFAPELVDKLNTRKNFSSYNLFAADIYALGITCLELLMGQKEIYKLNMFRTQEQQYKKELENIKNKLLKVSEFQRNPKNKLLIMLLKMLSFNENDRPQAIEICQVLVASKYFQIDALGKKNMKALIIQLISSFNPIINFKDLKLQTFESNIIKDSAHSNIIISLFQDSNIQLQRIHYQQINDKFNAEKFHQDCDMKGPTLVILQSNYEDNSFFGGMAVPSWESPKNSYSVSDPPDQYSWLFKIEFQGSQVSLHQWKCIKKNEAIYCNNNCGPLFGGNLYEGQQSFLQIFKYYSSSFLHSNSLIYKKLNLNEQLNNEKNLLFLVNKQMNLNCPERVKGKIMNENCVVFSLSVCEVFAIKK